MNGSIYQALAHWETKVFAHPELTAATKVTALALRSHFNVRTGALFPSVGRVAQITGQKKRSVVRQLRTLERQGLIERIEIPGSSNRYLLPGVSSETVLAGQTSDPLRPRRSHRDDPPRPEKVTASHPNLKNNEKTNQRACGFLKKLIAMIPAKDRYLFEQASFSPIPTPKLYFSSEIRANTTMARYKNIIAEILGNDVTWEVS